MKSRLTYLLMVFFTFSCMAQKPVEFYVSPKGNNNNPGTKEYPFLSFDKAKEAVVEAIASGLEGQDINVYFREGKYFFDHTCVIKGSEFSNGDNRITFSAYMGEKPVFSAGIELTNWRLLKDDLPFLPDVAKGKVWETSLPDTGTGDIAHFLCDAKGPLVNAVSSALYTAEHDSISQIRDDPELSDKDKSFFIFPEHSFRAWENIHDIEILTIPHYSWVLNVLPLKSIDMAGNIAYTQIPATYKICKGLHYGEPNLWIQNAIDYLDEPGEWVINSLTGKIYYWPMNGRPQDVFYPVLQEIIRVEGNLKNNIIAKNINFTGIKFTHGDRYILEKENTKHPWITDNKSDALLRFVDAENCTVDDCVFTNSGGNGIRFDQHAKNNKVINSEFNQLGGIGILFDNIYSDSVPDNCNTVINNRIHDVGLIYKHSAAIFLYNTNGNRIANNLIYNTPYNGIVITGKYAKNNIIEYNEFHHTDMYLHDGNALYLNSLNYNLIRRNYLHDNFSSKLHGIIRSDDWGRNMVITENIIYKFCGSGIRFKQPTVVTNNYIIDCISAKSADGDIISWSEFIGVTPSDSINGSIVTNNICCQFEGSTQPFFRMTFSPRYPHLKDQKANDIKIDNNLYYTKDDYKKFEDLLHELQSQGVEKNSLIGNPLFQGMEGRGFKLKDNSPAFGLGIKQIDFEDIGLLKKPVQ